MNAQLQKMLEQLRSIRMVINEIRQEIRQTITDYKELQQLLTSDLEAEAVGQIQGITGTVAGETAEMKSALDQTQT